MLVRVCNVCEFDGDGYGLFMTAFSIPFAGLGLYLVIGQWIEAAQAHRRVRYALSTRAAYVAKSGSRHSIECYPILNSSSIGLEKGHRADTVWFHVRSETDSDGDRSTTRIGFDHIDGGNRVFQLLRSIQTGTT